jgi:nitrate reductase beta subunit
MAYLFDIEVCEDEEFFWNRYEEEDEDEAFPEIGLTEEELDEMYNYFTYETYDDPIKMCNVPKRFDR